MTALSERPIFVLGHPRSGTTLLRFILSSHPRIYIPDETGFLPFLDQEPGAELSPEQVQQLVERIGRLNRAWHGIVEDLAAFYQALPEPTLRHALDALYRVKLRQQDQEAARWGDKTPTYVRYIPTLAAIFPRAQFVHLIRDGRDAALSAQAKWGQGRFYMDSYYLLVNWARNVEAGRRAGRQLAPERYLELHYEDLVTEPRPLLERLCAFLGEAFHPAMLDHTALAQERIAPGGHVEVRAPISTASVGRWRSEMSTFDRKLADRLAGDTLAASGYELARLGPLTAGEQIRRLGLAVKFLVVDGIRRTLTAVGLLTLNRRKRR